MATIPGSQFIATAPGLPVNVVDTTTGTGLPTTVPGAFNLEVFIGGVGSAPPVAPGYQGLAVLSPDGHTIDLISGAYAVTDNGTGDTLNADGSNETVAGGSAFSYLNLNGNNDVANGGSGGNLIVVNGSGDTVNGGTGPNTITVFGNGNAINGGTGGDTITAIGNNDTITSTSGADLINVSGTGDVVHGSAGDTINVFNTGDTVFGGPGSETIGVFANDDLVVAGTGSNTITLIGMGDTVAGGGTANIGAFGNNFTFNDTVGVYADTIMGFSVAAGDSIHLTTDTSANAIANSTLVNGGTDTLIHLSDGSTILLKGITHVDSSFFS